MVTGSRNITAPEFASATGWEIKPEGACKGDICVPLGGGTFDAADAAQRLGMGVARDAELNLWSFGPETIAGRALASAVAPELVLQDLDGKEFRLSSLRGQKVVLVAWAPY